MNKPELLFISVKNIETDGRAREEFGNLDDLKRSIQKHGLIHPITVSRLPNGRYKLLAGGRRLEAVKKLGWKEVPAVVYGSDLDQLEEKAIELQENLMRKSFTWQEEVKLKERIHETYVKLYGKKKSPNDPEGWSLRSTAKLIGVDPGQLSKELKLASMLGKLPGLEEKKSKTEAIKAMNKAIDDAQALAMMELVRKSSEQSKEEQGSSNLHFVRNMKEYQDAYVIGDALKKLKELPDGYYDIVELDPPYGIDLNEVKRSSTEELDQYSEVDASTYPNFIKDILFLVKQKMKPDSWLILWYAMEPWQETVFSTASRLRFKGNRVPLLWVKKSGQTISPSLYLASCYETAYYLRRGNAEVVRKGRSNVYEYQKDNEHPAGKPVALMRDILSTFGKPGARVLVPFAGSGSTLVAAFELGMKPIGFDLSEDYKIIYTKLLAKSGVAL